MATDIIVRLRTDEPSRLLDELVVAMRHTEGATLSTAGGRFAVDVADVRTNDDADDSVNDVLDDADRWLAEAHTPKHRLDWDNMPTDEHGFPYHA